ncbi:unnamed protein product [Linum trigynum]|uniref:Uncharacterized protein n=1 Tax=Linum trigynum TaxID=586398 RepID=A0AAV2FZG1_9ROSI
MTRLQLPWSPAPPLLLRSLAPLLRLQRPLLLLLRSLPRVLVAVTDDVKFPANLMATTLSCLRRMPPIL